MAQAHRPHPPTPSQAWLGSYRKEQEKEAKQKKEFFRLVLERVNYQLAVRFYLLREKPELFQYLER
jgi:hypothetical protein